MLVAQKIKFLLIKKKFSGCGHLPCVRVHILVKNVNFVLVWEDEKLTGCYI